MVGPFYTLEDGAIVEHYDVAMIMHVTTVYTLSADKNVNGLSPITLPIRTIEAATDSDYVLRDGINASFTPSEAVTAGTVNSANGDGVKIDYYYPMQSAEGYNPADNLDDGYTKLVEYHIQLPITQPTTGTISGTMTVPLPDGADGATAKIVSGASASASTATTVSFPVTLNVSGGVANAFGILVEYKPAPTEYTIAATAGAGGTITPSGAVTVAKGDSKAFTITPSAGYSISDVKVDGTSVGALASYEFTNVSANHTISATFTNNGGGGNGGGNSGSYTGGSSTAKSYHYTKGMDSKWESGSDKGLEFTVDGSLDKLVRVEANGKKLNTPADCTLTSGSTIITLTPSFLETLAAGTHKLTAVYSDGSVTTSFTIEKAAEVADDDADDAADIIDDDASDVDETADDDETDSIDVSDNTADDDSTTNSNADDDASSVGADDSNPPTGIALCGLGATAVFGIAAVLASKHKQK